MKLENNPALDALCGEYLLGTLHGAARRRFERALREEPRVALRLAYFERAFVPRYAGAVEVRPGPQVWKRLESELALARYRTPWHRRLGFWRALAAGATAALALGIAVQVLTPVLTERPVQIAQLEGKAEARVVAKLARERRVLELESTRPYEAGANRSFELWLLPAEGGPPVSLAVLDSLDKRFRVPAIHLERLRAGAKLAVSVEPVGGSPTGAPTGEVILSGAIAI